MTGPAQGFATGFDRIDAALVGTADIGVILAFRGTLPPTSPDPKQTIADWLADFEMELVAGDKLPGLVHHGFLGALDALWKDISTEVQKQMQASHVKRLFITGHSKGGAVAHLAAARFALSAIVSGTNITVRSFEGAHPGDQAFADAYQRMVADVVRYEFQDDIVPHVPPSLMLRQLFKSEPTFAAVRKLDQDFDYAPAGRLQFVDWNGAIQGSSSLLNTERFFHLAQKLAALDFITIIGDHDIRTNSGLMKALQA